MESRLTEEEKRPEKKLKEIIEESIDTAASLTLSCFFFKFIYFV